MGKERKGKQREVKDGKAKKWMKRIRTTESQRAVARTLVLEGYSQSEAASRTRMSQASVSNAMKRFKETGRDTYPVKTWRGVCCEPFLEACRFGEDRPNTIWDCT